MSNLIFNKTLSLNKKIRLRVVTDCVNDLSLEVNQNITLTLKELFHYLNDLFDVSNVEIYNNMLTATSNDRILCLTLLSQNLDWNDICRNRIFYMLSKESY